jgi:hypothetical protein
MGPVRPLLAADDQRTIRWGGHEDDGLQLICKSLATVLSKRRPGWKGP